MVIDTDNYVGLTLNGRGGNDTFNVTPGPIPVFVDGGDPIGSHGRRCHQLQPGGRLRPRTRPAERRGRAERCRHPARQLGPHRGDFLHRRRPGHVLGTNGDDVITIIARDSSTHAGADGVQDFTVSLNTGPSILFLNTPMFLVDALAGDDNIELPAPAPNNAVWNVGMTLLGNDGNDVINAAAGGNTPARSRSEAAPATTSSKAARATICSSATMAMTRSSAAPATTPSTAAPASTPSSSAAPPPTTSSTSSRTPRARWPTAATPSTGVSTAWPSGHHHARRGRLAPDSRHAADGGRSPHRGGPGQRPDPRRGQRRVLRPRHEQRRAQSIPAVRRPGRCPQRQRPAGRPG